MKVSSVKEAWELADRLFRQIMKRMKKGAPAPISDSPFDSKGRERLDFRFGKQA